MIAPLLALVQGPAAGAVMLALALAGGWGWLRLVHDPAIRAEYAAELDAQVAAARDDEQRRALAALASLEASHREAQARAATTRERIIRVPVTTACAAAPAVAAALDGLRPGPGPAGARGGAAAASGLPAAAAPAAARR